MNVGFTDISGLPVREGGGIRPGRAPGATRVGRWRCVSGVLLIATLALSGCVGDDRVDRSTALMDEALSDDLAGCSIAAAQDGEVVWAHAKGLADDTTGRAMDTSTRFNLASIAKQFTAIAVLQLVEEGALDLQDPVSVHVPELPEWADQVTLEQLMHHTSGVRDLTYPRGEPLTRATILEDLATIEGLHQGTTGFHYSNNNYVLLSAVVERVTGSDFAARLSEYVLDAAATGFEVVPYARGDDVAVGHSDLYPTELAEDVADWTGAGDVIGTPSALAAWADHYRDPQVLSAETLAAARDAAVPVEPGSSYGPGVFLWADGTLGHDGSDVGIISAFRIDPTSGMALAGACNSAALDPTELWNGLVAVWFGESD